MESRGSAPGLLLSSATVPLAVSFGSAGRADNRRRPAVNSSSNGYNSMNCSYI